MPLGKGDFAAGRGGGIKANKCHSLIGTLISMETWETKCRRVKRNTEVCVLFDKEDSRRKDRQSSIKGTDVCVCVHLIW